MQLREMLLQMQVLTEAKSDNARDVRFAQRQSLRLLKEKDKRTLPEAALA